MDQIKTSDGLVFFLAGLLLDKGSVNNYGEREGVMELKMGGGEGRQVLPLQKRGGGGG